MVPIYIGCFTQCNHLIYSGQLQVYIFSSVSSACTTRFVGSIPTFADTHRLQSYVINLYVSVTYGRPKLVVFCWTINKTYHHDITKVLLEISM